jgi:histidyl-tRNA synthetase
LGAPGVGTLLATCVPAACAFVSAAVSVMPLPAACAPAACASVSGVATVMSFGPRGLKPQLKAAAGSGARFAAIAFEDELKDGKVVVRELESGEQNAVPLDDVAQVLKGETSAI